jgi:hypothetical protein
VLKKNLGERQVQHDLACFILDLDSMVPWILVSSSEHTDEILGGAQHFLTGSLYIGEVEAILVIAPTMAVTTDVNEKSRHGGCNS